MDDPKFAKLGPLMLCVNKCYSIPLLTFVTHVRNDLAPVIRVLFRRKLGLSAWLRDGETGIKSLSKVRVNLW
jgi:hypothetical protein